MRRLKAALLLAPLLLVTGSAGSCSSENCSTVSCAQELHVWWRPDEIPSASTYRLCIDDSCEPVEPRRVGRAREILEVEPAGASGDKHVTVRLELLDSRGQVVEVFRGEGDKSGGCCPFIGFRAADGALTVDSSQLDAVL